MLDIFDCRMHLFQHNMCTVLTYSRLFWTADVFCKRIAVVWISLKKNTFPVWATTTLFKWMTSFSYHSYQPEIPNTFFSLLIGGWVCVRPMSDCVLYEQHLAGNCEYGVPMGGMFLWIKVTNFCSNFLLTLSYLSEGSPALAVFRHHYFKIVLS